MGFVKGEGLRLLRNNSSKAAFEENITQFKRRGYAVQNKLKRPRRILQFETDYRPCAPKLRKKLVD